MVIFALLFSAVRVRKKLVKISAVFEAFGQAAVTGTYMLNHSHLCCCDGHIVREHAAIGAKMLLGASTGYSNM